MYYRNLTQHSEIWWAGDRWTHYKISIKSVMQNVLPKPRRLGGSKNIIIHESLIRIRFAWPKMVSFPLKTIKTR